MYLYICVSVCNEVETNWLEDNLPDPSKSMISDYFQPAAYRPTVSKAGRFHPSNNVLVIVWSDICFRVCVDFRTKVDTNSTHSNPTMCLYR